MHTYSRVATSDVNIDGRRFRCAEDVVDYAARNVSIGATTAPEVWHLDDEGRVTCYWRASTLDTLQSWADDPWPLLRSREEGLRSGGCGRDWLIVDPRPIGLSALRPPVCEDDVDWFEEIGDALHEVGVRLVDAVVFDDRGHWWSMRELAGGTMRWAPPDVH